MRTILTTAFIVFGCFSFAAADELSLAKVEDLVREGRKLSTGQAKDLEDKLQENPKDAISRIQLMSYYGRQPATEGGEVRGKWQQHVLKMIEYHPRSEVFSGGLMAAGARHAVLVPMMDGNAFEEAIKLWQRLVKENGNDPQVLGNASLWFLLNGDRDQFAVLLRRAQKLDPNDFKWALEIMSLYAVDSRTARQLEGNARQSAFEKSLEYLEESYTLTEKTLQDAVLSNEEREALSMVLQMLGQNIAKAAVETGQNQKANEHATTLLASLPTNKKGWNYGNVIHDANIVLGRIAMKENRIAAAKHHLLEAGRTPGSPQLNSFGPNMALADELLKRGERQIALEYLELCAKFWKRPGGRLDEWAKTIEEGKTPNWRGQFVR